MLLMELHSMVGWHTKYFPVTVSVILVELMVVIGSYVRLGVDELAPPRKKGADLFLRASGLVAFLVAWILLALVLCNLLVDSAAHDKSGGYVWAFSLPWIGYGVVAAVAIVVRQFVTEGYPEWLSVFKDVAYGSLDNWSKGVFAFYVVADVLGMRDRFF